MNAKHQNQQNPPPKRRKCVDKQGNIRMKGAVKTGTCTTIIAKHVTENGFNCAWSRFVKEIEDHGGEVSVSTVTFK